VQTVSESLAVAGSNLLEGIAGLLGNDVPLEDLNKPDNRLLLTSPSFRFRDLPVEKKRLQSRLNEGQRRFFVLVRALLRGQSTEVIKQIDEWETIVCEVIEQEHRVWHSTTGEALAAGKEAIGEVLEAIGHLYDPAEGSVVLVPDTNALILSPAFQEWRFPDFPEFEVLLVPLLLSELDTMKTNHRDPNVRQKAQAVIRQIKEYGRRGSLSDGVTVVANRFHLRALAIEPHVKEALPWLDPNVPDDRILASTVEAMRMHPRSTVALVTGDINLQNKATFAGVPFLEPPAKQKLTQLL
jgi:hypothetical protein